MTAKNNVFLAIAVTLYIQAGHNLCQYKSLFLCHINKLICILLHMRMKIIYKMHIWSNIKVKIAQKQVGHILCQYRSLFSCHINELICILLHMRMNIIYKMCAGSNKSLNCMNFINIYILLFIV